MNLTTLKALVGPAKLFLKSNAPAILMGAGVVTTVASTVVACRATLKVREIVEEKDNALVAIRSMDRPEVYSEQDRRKDIAITYTRFTMECAKLYAPAVTLGLVGITCIVSGHNILAARNASLVAAYTALEKGFEQYRKRVADELGPEREAELRYGKIKTVEAKDGETTRVFEDTDSGFSIYSRFFDKVNSRNWSSEPGINQFFIQCQEKYANDLLRAQGHVFLNEVYDSLGLSRTEAGAVVGWVYDPDSDDNYIDFGVFKNIEGGTRFVNGDESSIHLDFNVDGVILKRAFRS